MSNTATSSDIQDDVFYDFGLGVSDIGLIQQIETPDINILYKEPHNSSIGDLWNKHNTKFSEFILSETKDADMVCEIGAGNGKIANILSNNFYVTCFEPSPSFIESKNVNIIKEYFSPKNVYDCIYCSHTLEHIVDLKSFMSDIKTSLSTNGKFIFSVPNAECGFNDNIITTLNTEHIYYFTKDSIRNFLSVCGFKMLRCDTFDRNSLFVVCQVGESQTTQHTKIVLDLFLDNIYKNASVVSNLKDCSIFGCYMMSAIFMYFNKSNSIKRVLDNDTLKHGKRLYGTNLICEKPSTQFGGDLILNGGSYHNELVTSLSSSHNIHSWYNK